MFIILLKGLQAAEKQKLSPWDILDGHRNPAPLSWAWFGATRLERKPLKYEEAHRLLRWVSDFSREADQWHPVASHGEIAQRIQVILALGVIVSLSVIRGQNLAPLSQRCREQGKK